METRESTPFDPEHRRKSHPAVLAAIGDDESDQIVTATALQAAHLWPDGVLHLVHVVDVLPIAQGARARPSEWPHPGIDDVRRRGHDYVERFRQTAAEALGRPVKGHLLFGAPAAEILKLARHLRAGLLVVGTREVGSLTRLLMGSTAHSLLHRAPCSVLLARAPAYVAEEGADVEEDVCPDCLWAEASSCGATPRCPRHALSYGLTHGSVGEAERAP